jgi:hypothetical protein
MFSTLRTRFGIPGVISVIALVFAMFGGAYAASNSSGGGKATASAKAKKGPRGPKGATGPGGPQGPAGPAGAAGKDGANGNSGAPGSAGTSVTSAPASAEECPSGGTKFTSASGTSHVCNGEAPAGGEFPEFLPSKKTETGVWGKRYPSVEASSSEAGSNLAFPISFPIPLEEAPTVVVVQSTEEGTSACPGRGGGSFPSPEEEEEEIPYVPTIPMAEPGFLCIYISGQVGAHLEEPPAKTYVSYGEEGWYAQVGASQTGTLLNGRCSNQNCELAGTWAVTAE